MLTSSTGAVTASFAYDPYGNAIAATGNATTPLRYAGQYTDTNTNLIYLKARWYDPSTGQFLSVDILKALTGQPYNYANDDPLNQTDPGGLYPGQSFVHSVGHFLTTPISLPNSRFFTGVGNVLYGGYKIGTGIFLVTVGTAADVTGIGALLGVPADAYGVYQIVTGFARVVRGFRQFGSAVSNPIVCKTPLRYGADIGLDLVPGGGGVEAVLGGLP